MTAQEARTLEARLTALERRLVALETRIQVEREIACAFQRLAAREEEPE